MGRKWGVVVARGVRGSKARVGRVARWVQWQRFARFCRFGTGVGHLKAANFLYSANAPPYGAGHHNMADCHVRQRRGPGARPAPSRPVTFSNQCFRQPPPWHGCCRAGAASASPMDQEMDDSMARTARKCRCRTAILAGASIVLLGTGRGYACDGKSYSLDVAVGQIASGGGLQVQLDKIKLLDKTPDKYTISVKDDSDLLGDHVVLVQYDTLSFKTRCGMVTIGADRKSMFQHGVLTVNWSYL